VLLQKIRVEGSQDLATLFFMIMYPIHTFDSIPSTNILAREMAEKGAVHGTAIVAVNQTEGRGRLGKKWHSATGKGLFCSIVIRPEDVPPRDYPKITLVAGLAVAQALDRLTGQNAWLKWPNDIFYAGKKCAGILTESSALTVPPAARFAVVGIGINVLNGIEDFPPELRDNVTSIFLETGVAFTMEQVLASTRAELLAQLELFSREGFSPILKEWKKRDYLFGRLMHCVSNEGLVIAGEALGPDEEGQLHVRDSEGRIHTVLSGDVRLAERKKAG
jgi:BirA family biotin operon repressor/biotin-[acetyl-CoA-carboxylase] ligase